MPAVPATHTFVNGVLDSSEENSYIRDPINFLLNPPMAELRQTVLQTIGNAAFTPISFTAEDVDKDPSGVGGHSTSVNTTRFTAQYTGWYQASGGIGWAANATGRRVCVWVVNGTIVNNSQVAAAATAASDCEIVARTKHVFLNAGDYIELHGFQESGGNLNTEVTGASGSHMSIRWVSN